MKRSEDKPLRVNQPKGEIRVCKFDAEDLEVMAIMLSEAGDFVQMECPLCGQVYEERPGTIKWGNA